MSNPRRSQPADPDFDRVLSARVRLLDFEPTDHQKLVVNPFLAVLALIGVFNGVGWILESVFPPAILVLVLAIFLLPRMIHFHCLDCGETGAYPRWDRHACSTVVARWEEGRPSGFASSRVQLIAWGWLLGSIAVLVLVSWA